MFEVIDSFIDAVARKAVLTEIGPPYRLGCELPRRDELAKALQVHFDRSPARIPRTIHQIWIGPQRPPWSWIDTFRQDFTKEFPEWTYRLWRDDDLANFDGLTGNLVREETVLSGQANILRYEILYRYGGLYIDADCAWLNRKPLDDVRFLAHRCGLVAGREDAVMLANSVIGASPGNPLLRLVLRILAATFHDTRLRRRWPTWVATGPRFFSEVVRDLGVTVLPRWYFYPVSWHGLSQSIDTTPFRDSYMIQYGYSTNQFQPVTRDPVPSA